MLEPNRIPQPLFASPQSMIWPEDEYFAAYPCVRSYLNGFPVRLYVGKDFRSARHYLSLHNHTQGTYGNYRGFIERLLLWSWIFREKSALELKREDFVEFVNFCKSPASDWVGDVPRRRFIGNEGQWSFNPDWRPLDVRSQTRCQFTEGEFQTVGYKPFTSTLRQLLSICSSFYNFLHREGLAAANPVVAARPQHGRALHFDHPTRNVISAQHVSLIMHQLELNAAGSLDGERALFIVAAAVYLYLRPSDLATANEAFPTMDAFRLEHGNWWLVLDARNPPLRIPVGQDFLQYLVRYRVSRGLSPLPEINEQVPLLETVHGRSGLSARRIKEIVKTALAEIHRKLKCDGHSDAELELLKTVSLRWFRDSGAKLDARVRAPADLQKSLGNVSLSYVYGRYYAE
ncbi:integrase [Pseudomonas chlororaphis]|uniref:integrase n=1 Tax=Pseudomonas chlororaphis TaxID=587753 RepID=UPI001FF0A528|nr:integrase [Pseudomonas chlororaphis]